jgi:hypothetical protein
MDFQRFSRPRVSSFCFPDWVSCALRLLLQTISESNQIAEYDQRQPDRRCLMVPGDRWPEDEQHHADREDDVPVRMIVPRAHRRLLIRGHRSSSLRYCVLRNRFVHNFPPDTPSIRPNHPARQWPSSAIANDKCQFGPNAGNSRKDLTKASFVTGHDFSRAAKRSQKKPGFSPAKV